MASILDLFGVSSGDKQKDEAINQGLLHAGLTLMQSRGKLAPAIGQAGLSGLQAFQQHGQQEYVRKMQQAQLAEIERKRVQADAEDKFRASLPSPLGQANQAASAAGPLGTVAAAQAQPPVDPYQQLLHGAAQSGAIPIQSYLSTMAPKAPEYKTVGDSLVQIGANGVREAYRAPKQATPTEIAKLMQEREALPPGDPRREAYDNAIRKATTHAPGTQVNVNTAKPFLNTVAEGLGKQLDTGLGEARAATNAVNTAHQLKTAIDSGKIVSGPGASFRIFGLQLGQTLGLSGKDGAETLANTRNAVQAMAKAELDAAQQMKGQGQITEAERDIIRRAASGNVDGLTSAEMRLLADAMEKTARHKIKSHQKNVQGLQKMPGAEPIMPFYQVEEPAPYAPPANQRIRKYNPATGKIE